MPGRRPPELTPREWDVLVLMREGLRKLQVPDRKAALRLLETR